MLSVSSAARAIITTFVCAFLPALLTSCSTPSTAFQDMDGTPLNQFDYAIYASVYHTDVWAGGDGLVLLAHGDELTSIPHEAMDVGQFSWTTDSLFWSDEKYDYIVTTAGSWSRIESPKTDYMDGLVVLDDKKTRIGVYNAGNHGNGFISEIVLSNETEAFLEETNSPLTDLTAACGQNVYRLDEAPITEVEIAGGDRVTQLTEDGKLEIKNLGTLESLAPEGQYNIPDAPCVDNKIYAIATNVFDSDSPTESVESYVNKRGTDIGLSEDLGQYVQEGPYPNTPYLVTLDIIDVSTMTRQLIPLITEKGETFIIENGGSSYAEYNSSSLHGNDLIWFSGDGRLLKTDITTGITRSLNDSYYSPTFWETNTGLLSFTHNRAALMVERGETGAVTITEYDLESGSELRVTEYPDMREYVGSLILRGFSANPNNP